MEEEAQEEARLRARLGTHLRAQLGRHNLGMRLRKAWPLHRAHLPAGVPVDSQVYLLETKRHRGAQSPAEVGGPLLLTPRSALRSRLPMRGTHFSPNELLRDDIAGLVWRPESEFRGRYVWVLVCDKQGHSIRSALPQLTQRRVGYPALTYEERAAVARTLFCSRAVLRPSGELKGLYRDS